VSLYAVVLFLHSYLRWGVVVAAVVVVARAFGAWRKDAPFTEADGRRRTVLTSLVDAQFLLGLLLYVWLSPISAAFFADPKHAVHDHVLRFFGLEHAAMMLLAVGVLHGGLARSKRVAASRARHRLVWTSAAAFLVLSGTSIPWPGLRHGRPLFRTELAGAKKEPDAAAEACPPIYGERCTTCHGASGRADGIAGASLHPPPRNFTDAKWQAATSDERIRDVIHDGGFAHGLNPAMPAQPDLTRNDLDVMVKCVRSFTARAKSK
jgi:mono/diheme cytochrome c family protein